MEQGQLQEPVMVRYYPEAETQAVMVLSPRYISQADENEILRKLLKAIELQLAVSELER